MDIDSPVQTVTHTGRVSRPPGEWWVVPTTIIDTPMPDFNNPVMDPDKEVLITSRNIVDDEEPKFYRQVITGPNADLWHSAIEGEMDAHRHNHTWDVVDRPTDRKIVDSNWVFKINRLSDGSIDKFKARLVAKGFSQIQGPDYDEMVAPLVRFYSLHLILSIVPANGFVPQQLDVKGGILEGELKVTIYMRLLEGYRDGNKVAHLKRCIYGLKQSPREWYSRLTAHLRIHGFDTSNCDPCVLRHKSDQFYIAVYVEDLTLYGPPGHLMDTTVLALETEFEVTNMGQLHWLLGIQITFNRDSIELSQEAVIDKILERFQMNDSHPTLRPIDLNTRLTKAESVLEAEEHRLYQSIMGSCKYLVACTRPDLAYPVSYLSQFLAAPSKSHLTAAKRLLRYIKGTKDLKLSFPCSYASEITLEAYSDSDYGNCLDTRQSISGNLFRLNNSTICWRSKKQKSVSTSTCDADYMAHALATKQCIWLTNTLEELNMPVTNAAMFCNNKAAIDIAYNHNIGDRSKHIDIANHLVGENVESGQISLLQVESAENLADICTEGLPQVTLRKLSNALMDAK
jgi:hypothetical protein